MASGSTTLRGRPYPLNTDAPQVATDVQALATNLDQVANVTSGSTLPVSGMVAGDEFLLTTTSVWYKYNGSAWFPMDIGTHGSVSITASQTTVSSTPTLLTTPDQVTGIILPTNGLIMVGYQATWSASGGSTAEAQIYLGSNGVQYANMSTSDSPTIQVATMSSGEPSPLTTSAAGLTTSTDGGPYTGDVTTGQILGTGNLGGPCYIFAAAGSYAVSVRFLNSGSIGTTTVSNRKLWVRAITF